MEPRCKFGLVCQTTDASIRYKTVTRTRLLALTPEAASDRLRDIYRANVATLRAAVGYCAARGIRLYRLPTGLLPFADHELGEAIAHEFAAELAIAGREARAQNVRLISHPDQYVVLNSHSEAVVANALRALEAEGRLFDAIGAERSSWAAINIHGGKGNRRSELVDEIRRLPNPVRSRLTIENDERSYGAADILDIARAASVPMVFDAHHHLVRERLESYDDPSIDYYTQAAAETWPDPNWQVVHISNGREHLHDRHHSDYITAMPRAFERVAYVEVEAKAKELAVEALLSARN